MTPTPLRPSAAVAALALLMACNSETDEAAIGPYDVSITWTEHGVPHIQAEDEGSLGYGIGVAMARHHGCTIVDQVLKATGRRAEFFGEDYIDADFGWRHLQTAKRAEAWLNQAPDHFRARMQGYTAGVNQVIADGDVPAACAGEDWVQQITLNDAVAYTVGLGMDGSGAVFVSDVGAAQPPGTAGANALPTTPDAIDPIDIDRLEKLDAVLNDPSRGSNGWAIGSERSADGGGLMLSNTHFPAWGEKRWFELHLTLGDELDAYGATLIGVPLVAVGFNADVAWTHTVSFAPRFTVYALNLDPSDPTSYVVDGSSTAMTSETYTIQVKDGDGTREETRTLYRSEVGPIINAPVVGWSDAIAVALRDANADNQGLFEVWYAMDKADSLEAFEDAHTTYQGIPWVYTLAASKEGEVYFADTSRVPYLTAQQWSDWEAWRGTSGLAQLLANQFWDQAGAIVLPWEDRSFDWTVDPEAVIPGTVPPSAWPEDHRNDYAFNANDSHWLHNVEEPLEGQLAQYGPEGTPRSARTRMNGIYLSDTGANTASGDDGKFTLDEVEQAAMSMRSSIVEASQADVVARCKATPSFTLDGTPIDLTEACDVLDGWSGRYTADASGAVLWREFMGSGLFDRFDLPASGGGFFEVPFDADDPLGTPNTLVPAPAEGDDPVLHALAIAITRLDDAGIDLDVTLGEVQRMPFLDGQDFPVHGASYWEGTIGIADWSGGGTTTLLDWGSHPGFENPDTERSVDGQYLVNNGNSYMLAVAYEGGVPKARAVTTYSQSADEGSPYLHDQSDIYASGSFRPVFFTAEEVRSNAITTENLTREASDDVKALAD